MSDPSGKKENLKLPLLLLWLALSAVAILPTAPLASGSTPGLVCLSNLSTSCPPEVAVFTGKPGTQITVRVVIQGSSSFNGFNIFVVTNPNHLLPLSVDFTGTLLPEPFSAMVCINGQGPQPECNLWLQNGPGVVQALANGGPTPTPSTGLLFSITYDVVEATTSTFIAFVCQYAPSGPTFFDCANVFDTSNVQEEVQNAFFISDPSVVFSVQTDKDSYLVGEVVRARLSGTNTGTEPVTYTFTDGCSGFRFEITDSQGALVFSNVPPPSAVCILVVTEITIQPGETKQLSTLSWSQTDMSGNQVPEGKYNIFGVLHYQNPYQTFALAAKTILISSMRTITFDQTRTFDDVTIRVFGSLTVDTEAKTLVGTITVTAVNNTSGETIFSKTFEINLRFATGNTVRFVLEIPLVLTLAAECAVDVAARTASCMVSRTPDMNHDSVVNILDLVRAAIAFGSKIGSSNYNPAADLNASGTVDILDLVIMAFNFGAPVFS